jgi:hypothetical protein
MVNIDGYTITGVGTKACDGVCDMGAKYTKEGSEPIMSVTVEIYLQTDEAKAISWVHSTKFSNKTDSRNWEFIDFMGYPSSLKAVSFTISDRKTEEIFMRVAQGNAGILAKFTQTTNMYGTLTPLEEAQSNVEEVIGSIVKAIEEG